MLCGAPETAMSASMNEHQELRLSIGMPVYNGAATLEAAIRSVLDQSEPNIEIILSDNGSTDATAAIAQRLADQDKRLRYIRQPVPLSPTENFAFVLNQAKAPYFMWAAHDDLRDLDTAQRLLEALDHNPGAILAFGDLVELLNGVPNGRILHFANADLSKSARLRQMAFGPLHHLYGIWRTQALRRIEWQHVDWWHDTPLMMAASMLGDFVHVPGPRFFYQFNPRPFFGWRHQPGMAGLRHSALEMLKRTGELVRLVYLCGWSVWQVAGPWRGLEAALYGAIKIITQVSGFVWRRVTGASASVGRA